MRMTATGSGLLKSGIGAVAVLIVLPAIANAASSYTCAFNEGCGTADCGADAAITATLEASDDGWHLHTQSEVAGTFTEIANESTARHFVSTDIDPDAGAAALLTIFDTGVAMMSLHGTFVTPMGQTYSGECTAETG